MYQVAIIMNNTEANLSLSYKDKESAKQAYKRLDGHIRNKSEIDIEDDYGYCFMADTRSISYILFIDLDQAQFCQHDKNLAIARAGKKLAEQVDAEQAELLGLSGVPKRSSSIIQ